MRTGRTRWNKGARGSLLRAWCLRPLIPGTHGEQASLVPEWLRVETASGDLVGTGIEGEVFGDEGGAGGIGRQEPPEIAGGDTDAIH